MKTKKISGNSIVENRILYCPFEMVIDPMELLLLINIEKDPDTTYVGFEPQVFNDSTNGKGLLVLGWRVDGRVDVYHQPTLRPDPNKYNIAGKGLAHLVERPMESAFFEVNERGAQAFFEFKDVQGRQIKVSLSEKNPKKRNPFGLLAPMGDAAENPMAMPLVYVHDFYFVRRKNTEFSIIINNKYHAPDKFIMPIDWSSMYFSRYSSNPLIVTLNPAFDGPLPILSIDENGKASLGETCFELITSGPKILIKCLSRTHKNYTIQLSFNPAFPNIADFPENGLADGKFEIQGHPSTGCITGIYQVKNAAGNIQITMVPSGGWIPNENKLSLKFLYLVAEIFRKWPTTYRWEASIKKDDNNQLLMKSSWKRVRK